MADFIDTNVLVYAHSDNIDPRSIAALELVERLALSRSGVVSVQVLQELYVALTRKAKRRIDATQAREHCRALTTWPVHSPNATDVLSAINLADAARISFWDAMIVNSAAKMKCKIIWTEDLNHGQVIAGVTVRNPFRDHAERP